MRCLYCGKRLAFLKRLTGGGEFCSDAHRIKYQEEYNQLALSRLLQAQGDKDDKSNSVGRTLVPAEVAAEPVPASQEAISAGIPEPAANVLSPEREPAADSRPDEPLLPAGSPEMQPSAEPSPASISAPEFLSDLGIAASGEPIPAQDEALESPETTASPAEAASGNPAQPELPPSAEPEGPPMGCYLVLGLEGRGAQASISTDVDPVAAAVPKALYPVRAASTPVSPLDLAMEMASGVAWQPDPLPRNTDVTPVRGNLDPKDFSIATELPRRSATPATPSNIPQPEVGFGPLRWNLTPRLASPAAAAWSTTPAEFADLPVETGSWTRLDFPHSGFADLAEAAARMSAELEEAARAMEAAAQEAAREAAEREAAAREAVAREAAEREAAAREAAEREAGEREAAEREAAEQQAAEREALAKEIAAREAAEAAAWESESQQAIAEEHGQDGSNLRFEPAAGDFDTGLLDLAALAEAAKEGQGEAPEWMVAGALEDGTSLNDSPAYASGGGVFREAGPVPEDSRDSLHFAEPYAVTDTAFTDTFEETGEAASQVEANVPASSSPRAGSVPAFPAVRFRSGPLQFDPARLRPERVTRPYPVPASLPGLEQTTEVWDQEKASRESWGGTTSGPEMMGEATPSGAFPDVATPSGAFPDVATPSGAIPRGQTPLFAAPGHQPPRHFTFPSSQPFGPPVGIPLDRVSMEGPAIHSAPLTESLAPATGQEGPNANFPAAPLPPPVPHDPQQRNGLVSEIPQAPPNSQVDAPNFVQSEPATWTSPTPVYFYGGGVNSGVQSWPDSGMPPGGTISGGTIPGDTPTYPAIPIDVRTFSSPPRPSNVAPSIPLNGDALKELRLQGRAVTVSSYVGVAPQELPIEAATPQPAPQPIETAPLMSPAAYFPAITQTPPTPQPVYPSESYYPAQHAAPAGPMKPLSSMQMGAMPAIPATPRGYTAPQQPASSTYAVPGVAPRSTDAMNSAVPRWSAPAGFSNGPRPTATATPLTQNVPQVPQMAWQGPGLLSAVQADHPVFVVPPPKPETTPLPVTLHAMAAPAAKPAIVPFEALRAWQEPQAPRSAALPLRALMYFADGAGRATKVAETKSSDPTEATADTPSPKGKPGRKRSDVKVTPPETAKASASETPVTGKDDGTKKAKDAATEAAASPQGEETALAAVKTEAKNQQPSVVEEPPATAPAPRSSTAVSPDSPSGVQPNEETKPSETAAAPVSATKPGSPDQVAKEIAKEAEAEPKSPAVRKDPPPSAPVPPSVTDLGLPALRLAENESRWSRLPAVVKIGIAAAIVAAISVGAYFLTHSSSATASQPEPVPAVEAPYEEGTPLDASKWVENWTNVRRNRGPRLDILPASIEMSDYRIEFRSQILSQATGWVYRAQDPNNYYAARLEVITTSAKPEVVLSRVSVVDGRTEHLPNVAVPEGVAGGVKMVKFEALGNKFTLWVEDQQIAEWTDSRISSGGAGIYAEPGDAAQLQGAFRVTPLLTNN